MLKTVVAAAVVVSMVSCSSEADFDNTNTTESNKQESVETPINFGSYLAQSKSNLSRAGETETTSASSEASTRASVMTTDELKEEGFGVIALSTGTTQYTTGSTISGSNYMFMYNTKVSGDGWTYSPVMYWPNGGQSDASNAKSGTPNENVSYLSFFAYAPYKQVTASTGATGADTGITALSNNAKAGDPTVTYKLGASGAAADLLWGTAGTNSSTTSGSEQNGTDFNGAAKAKVKANLSKMKVNGKVQFNFKHALAKFGGTGATGTNNKTSGLMVVADIDKDNAVSGGKLDANTKITVKSIKIESVKASADGAMTSDNSIATSGTLNLATGVWDITNATTGKIDYEINSPAVSAQENTTAIRQAMNSDIAEPATVAKSIAGWDALPAGVTDAPKSVYTEETPLLIIPDGASHTFRVTITYIVRTKNENLPNGYFEDTCSYYKDLVLNNVSLNAKYNLLIHLGLTSVKFDATVTDWTNTVAGSTQSGAGQSVDGAQTEDPMVIYMPANVAGTASSN